MLNQMSWGTVIVSQGGGELPLVHNARCFTGRKLLLAPRSIFPLPCSNLSQGGESLPTTRPRLPCQKTWFRQLGAVEGDWRERGKEKSEHFSPCPLCVGRSLGQWLHLLQAPAPNSQPFKPRSELLPGSLPK